MYQPERPRRPAPSAEQQVAIGFCDEVERVLGLFRQADQEDSTATAKAEEAAAALLHHSLYDNLNIRFLVSIPEGVRAELSENYEVSQRDVRQFEATEISFVGYGKEGFRIDFHDTREDPGKDHWLSVYSYDIEVSPLPDEQPPAASEEPGER